MKSSKCVIISALFLGLASVSIAGPGPDYFQRRANKTTATPPTASATVDSKKASNTERSGCGSCRDVISYKPGPSGKTTTRIVKHECSGC
jgi:hypothetical protein